MKLVPGKKLEKNLKLMRSCSQVRVIQLTEEIAKITYYQKRLIEHYPHLKTMLTHELNRRLALAGEAEIVNPETKDLIGVPLSEYEQYNPSTEELPEVNSYMSTLRKTNRMQSTLADYQALNELLAKEKVSFDDFNKFINSKDHTRIFQRFVSDMKKHSPMFLSLGYKTAAKDLAQRNDLANKVFLEKTDQAFDVNAPYISLSKDLNGKFIHAGAALVAATTLSAVLIAGGFGLKRADADLVQGDINPHTGITEVSPSSVVALSPEQAPEVSQDGIFSNSININSYKTACEDFFQKTAEVYKYNTGKDIDLSGYGQNNISVSNNARILEVEKDGVTYRISTQSNSASNPTYLREALDALGVSYTEYTSGLTCIIDKYDDSKSIAIVDSQGNPVRSGKVLEPTVSGGGYMYNQQMVQNGRAILEAEGRDTSSLSEGACVAAYILSDSYNLQDPELSKALGETDGLASTIKDYFYYGTDGKSEDTYAVYVYGQNSAKFAQSFNNRANGTQQITIDSQAIERDER